MSDKPIYPNISAFDGIIFEVVEPGTIITDEQSGEMLEVTDGSIVFKRDHAFVTKWMLDNIVKRCATSNSAEKSDA